MINFITFIALYFFAFMVCFGFYSLFIMLGWLEDPQPDDKPPDKPLNEPINNLPKKVSAMEWEVVRSNTKAIHVRDINSNPINLEL